ncbi:hypothetical protein [Pseudomonas sp. 10S4]|uniref:hypothetical protein n=1 Tax=Pseudomonas sp. 10S4 TaxID=3048583 RepID=UPI002B236D73|nr:MULTISPECIES: hypothetical protein [unclassified Pseudomonas]MEB0222985.1 hypothetical protein [Pseudomonas sp. 5S1]MEB0298940.1 hypothetical protein [Pseudomonas sp. 10S4]
MIKAKFTMKTVGGLPEIIVLVGPLGAGMSTCVSSICADFGCRAVALSTQSVESSFYPSEWLTEYFGLFNIKRPKGQLLRTLIAMTKLVNLKLVVLEDFQDLKVFHSRHLAKLIDDLARMRDAIPELCILITINRASLAWLKSILDDSPLIPFLIMLEPLQNDRSFKDFIAQHANLSSGVMREILDTPSVVDMLFQSADGSIGRLTMMLDMLAEKIESSSNMELLSSVKYVTDLLRVRRK